MLIFETPRLLVRPITPGDFDHFYRMHSDPEIMRYIKPVLSREESDAFVKKALKGFTEDFLGRWVVVDKESGNDIGTFVIVPIPNEEEKIQLGYLLLRDYWGKGYASELVRAGLDYFRDRTPLDRIFGVTESENTASQKVLLKNGFRLFDEQPEGEKILTRYVFDRTTVIEH